MSLYVVHLIQHMCISNIVFSSLLCLLGFPLTFFLDFLMILNV